MRRTASHSIAPDSEREELLSQLREANEGLVLASLRAEELLAEAVAARALAIEDAAISADRLQRSEVLALDLASNENALRAREAEANATNRAKDEFLAMLGHELRNPLAPIITALDVIAMDGDDSHPQEHLIIGRQVRQLVRLVDDLLDVSRIDRGKIELRREPIELADVVSRAVEMTHPLIQANRHTLRVDVPAHGITIHGDLVRMTQVVANLLTNAAKYTPDGGTITVTGEHGESSAVLRVRDSGIGISPAMLPRVFDLFAQENQRLDREPGGLGLGLTIVRSLVALHGGTVSAHSEGLGRGSEFSIELPAMSVGWGELASAPAPAALERVSARKILLVDDNRIAAELTGLALSKLGHRVRIAFDGPSALAIARSFTPHVALLDIGLPGMDGYELVRRLHDVWSTSNVRFVAITGYGQDSDHERSLSAGFDSHLVKPVDVITIQHEIHASARSA